jgi:exopolysaccharide biosynthesis WecB/TagA/CpsF family protein
VRQLFLSADLIHADGTPLVFASRLRCPVPLPERVATTDLFHDVARMAQERDVSFFLLGGTPEVMDAAVRKVRLHYGSLRIAGCRHGYFAADEADGVLAEINAARPDILWVGMGVPLEQSFVVRYRSRLTGVGLIKTSGGLFDFLSGRNRRAPQWMQAVGLEWLYRVAQEPRRLAYRYLTTNPHALYVLLTGGPRTPGGAGTLAPGDGL